ncbi:MAG: site-2 protease family protein, partial [Actinomycetota bacterium]
MVAGILVFVLGVLLMILVHELGHFVAAKRFGIKVEEFFIGFGPRLWSFRRGETEYGLKAIPVGGYVR